MLFCFRLATLFLLGILLFPVGRIDGFDLFVEQLGLILEFQNLSVHLVDQTVSLLAAHIEESYVVLIGIDLAFQLFVTTEQAGALIVNSLIAMLGNILQIVLEIVEFAAGHRDIELLIQAVQNVVVLFVNFILVSESQKVNFRFSIQNINHLRWVGVG